MDPQTEYFFLFEGTPLVKGSFKWRVYKFRVERWRTGRCGLEKGKDVREKGS
jgi:hypothetical protein